MSDREAKLELALRDILFAIGPKPPDCGCDGCHEEIKEAIRLASEALED